MMEVSEKTCTVPGCTNPRRKHAPTSKTQGYINGYCEEHHRSLRRLEREQERYEVTRPDGEIRHYAIGSASVRAAREAGWPVSRVRVADGSPSPTRPVRELSPIDAANRAAKAQLNEMFADQYRQLDQQWDMAVNYNIIYQVYGWSHADTPNEVKIGICDVYEDRVEGALTDYRHFNPIKHFAIGVGTKAQAKAVEDEFKRRYADVRLPHVSTGRPSEFFAMHGRHAENAVKKIIRELT